MRGAAHLGFSESFRARKMVWFLIRTECIGILCHQIQPIIEAGGTPLVLSCATAHTVIDPPGLKECYCPQYSLQWETDSEMGVF